MEQWGLLFTNSFFAASMFYLVLVFRVFGNLLFYVSLRQVDNRRDDHHFLKRKMITQPIGPTAALWLVILIQLPTLNFMGVWSWLVAPFLLAQIYFLFVEDALSLVWKKNTYSDEYVAVQFPRKYFRTYLFEMAYIASISTVFCLRQ